MSDETTPDLAELQRQLKEATTAYEEASCEENRARNVATDARNRLNRAQKALDGAVAQLRKNAPRDTDWSKTNDR